MLTVGARVQYTRKFLKSILSPPTSAAWRQVGTVVEIGAFVMVRWDGEEEPRGAKSAVLELVGRKHYIDDSSPAELEYERIYGLNGRNAGK